MRCRTRDLWVVCSTLTYGPAHCSFAYIARGGRLFDPTALTQTLKRRVCLLKTRKHGIREKCSFVIFLFELHYCFSDRTVTSTILIRLRIGSCEMSGLPLKHPPYRIQKAHIKVSFFKVFRIFFFEIFSKVFFMPNFFRSKIFFKTSSMWDSYTVLQ